MVAPSRPSVIVTQVSLGVSFADTTSSTPARNFLELPRLASSRSISTFASATTATTYDYSESHLDRIPTQTSASSVQSHTPGAPTATATPKIANKPYKGWNIIKRIRPGEPKKPEKHDEFELMAYGRHSNQWLRLKGWNKVFKSFAV